MVKLKLVPYKIKLKNVELSGQGNPVYYNLNTINFSDIIVNFLDSILDISVDGDTKQAFNCEYYERDPDDVSLIKGVLNCGYFGYSSKITHTESFDTRRKTVQEAEQLNYYFVLKIYDNYGILLLNRFKQSGIKSKFHSELNQYLQNNAILPSDFFLYMNPVVSSGLADVKSFAKLRFLKDRVYRDVERQYDPENTEPTPVADTVVEEKILKVSKRAVPTIIDLIGRIMNNKDLKGYYEVDDVSYDDLKVDVIMNDGSSKVIQLSDGFEYNESFELDIDGDFPTLDVFIESSQLYFERVLAGCE